MKGSVDVSYSSYISIDAKVSVEGPIVEDKLAVRLAGRHYHTDGQHKNAGYSGRLKERDNAVDRFQLHRCRPKRPPCAAMPPIGKIAMAPSAQSPLTEADYNCNVGGNGRVPAGSTTGFNYICGNVGNIVPSKMSQNIDRGGSLNFGGVTNPAAVGATALRRIYLTIWASNVKPIRHALDDRSGRGRSYLSAAVSHNRNQWAALTDTYNRPPDGTGYFSTVYLLYDIENNSAELRLASPDNGRLTYMVGGNYYWESIDFFTRASRGATPTNLGAPTDYRARTFGVFGSASYELLDGLKLSGEARYQWDRVNHIGYSAVTGEESANLAKTFKSFTPRVILNYEITPTVSTYASWSRGTRPGTFNTNYALFSPAIQAQLTANAGREIPIAVAEEKLTMYEAGLKGEFFGRRLRVLSAFYYGEWRNRQINQNIAYLTGTTTSTATLTFPDGSTNLWGVELEGAFQATRDLTLEGTFNWAATDIRSVACSECVAIDGVINPVGNTMERYPEYSGTAAINYQPRINDDWTGIVRVDYIYTGKQYATAANVAWINSASRINLRVGASSAKYTLELFARNIFDDKTPSNVLRNTNPNGSAAQGLNTIALAAPERATIGVRGAVRF
ncbi:MAG: TonB-dependent receptor [Sphingobium sp.]|nr:TonB-dependent receptor [Sphingobium sp.]